MYRIWIFTIATVLLTAGGTYAQEGEGLKLGGDPDAVAAAKGEVWSIGYQATYLFDYGTNMRGFEFDDYEVDGLGHGVSISYQNYKGDDNVFSHGLYLFINYFPDLSIDGSVLGFDVEADMERWDVEGWWAFGGDSFDVFGSPLTAQWLLPIKFTYVTSEFSVQGSDWFDRRQAWTLTGLGISAQWPIGGADSPFSINGTITGLIGIVWNDDTDPATGAVATYESQTFTTFAVGVNGTIGIGFQATDNISINVGYRGQMLYGAGEEYDAYQGAFGQVSINF